MPGLQGYKGNGNSLSFGANTSGGSRPSPTANTAVGARPVSTAGTTSLINKLSGMFNMVVENEKKLASEQARQDASEDSRLGNVTRQSVDNAYGASYNQTADATWAAKTELDIAQQSDEFARQHEDQPMSYASAMRSHVKGLSENAPTEALRATALITGDKYTTSTFGKLKLIEKRKIDADTVETFQRSLGLNINQVIEQNISGQKEFAKTLVKKNEDYIKRMELDGLISPADAQAYTKDAKFKVTYGVDVRLMEGMIESGDLVTAKKFLDKKTTKNRTDMDVIENKKYRDDLGKMYSNAIKAEKTSQVSLKEDANLAVNNVVKVFDNGQMPSTDDISMARVLAPYSSKVNQQKLEIAEEAYDVVVKYKDLTLPEQEALYTELQANKTGSVRDMAVNEQVGKVLATRRAGANKDPQSQSVKEGRTLATEPMTSMNGVESIFAGLDARKQTATSNNLEYGAGHGQLLTAPEAASWSDYMNSPEVDTNEKLAFISSLYATDEQAAEKIFSQISEKNAPTFAFAAEMVTSGNTRAAELSFKGRNANVELEESFVSDTKIAMGNAFSASGSKGFNAYLQGVTNYAKGVSLSEENISYEEAIEQSVGTIKDYNGQDVVIPYGTEVDVFNDWLDNIVIPGHPGIQESVRDMPDMFDGDTQLKMVRPGEYRVYVKAPNGRMTPQLDKVNGGSLIIKYEE